MPFFGSPPKAYYAHPALPGTKCQSLGSIGRVVSEKNGNRQTNKQTHIHFENRRPYRDRLHLRFKPNDRNRRSNIECVAHFQINCNIIRLHMFKKYALQTLECFRFQQRS